MPTKTYATADEVPADLKDSAVETKDGKFLVFEEADTSELEAQITAEAEKRVAAEKLMRKTAAELQKLQTQRKAADAGMTEEKLKELREEARQEVLDELKPQLDAAETLKAQNRALVLDADMKARALKAGVLPAKIDDWWALRGKDFDLTDDGKPMVKDKPGVDPDKHLATLLKRNPEWIVGTKASGSGAHGTTGGMASDGAFSGHMSPSARLEAAHDAGIKE
jgi:hypothetical protein